jgi:hypothetical protein
MEHSVTAAFKWLGTTFTILGALFTTAGLDPLNVYAFNLGAILWLVAAVRMREPSLIAVNAALLAIYFVGFILRII